MTGIQFMDNITAPRRSSIRLSQSRARKSISGEQKADTPLADYFSALAIDIPHLSLYNRISHELKKWIDKSREGFAQVEEEAEQMTPELFREYALANEEGRREISVIYILSLSLAVAEKAYLATIEPHSATHEGTGQGGVVPMEARMG